MMDTSSGERTAGEAVGSGFAETIGLTSGEEATTDSPGCDKGTDDVPLEAVLETGAAETSMEERAAAKLLLVCLAVITARATERRKKRNN